MPVDGRPVAGKGRKYMAESFGWEREAHDATRDRDYYRSLVVGMGRLFGDAAKTQDDGGIVEDVLCAKVPELVKALASDYKKLRATYDSLLGEYTARAGTYQDREVQIDKLTHFIRANYIWEARSGEHGQMKQADIAILYMGIERRRWRVRVREWWYRNVKYRGLWRASTTHVRKYTTPPTPIAISPGQLAGIQRGAENAYGHWCQNCSRVEVEIEGSWCPECVDKFMKRRQANETDQETQ
jgi:hypothetical protein